MTEYLLCQCVYRSKNFALCNVGVRAGSRPNVASFICDRIWYIITCTIKECDEITLEDTPELTSYYVMTLFIYLPSIVLSFYDSSYEITYRNILIRVLPRVTLLSQNFPIMESKIKVLNGGEGKVKEFFLTKANCIRP